MLILCLVLHLHGGGYPEQILFHNTQLNNDNERIGATFFGFYNAILFYWFPFTEGYAISPKWPIHENSRKAANIINFVVKYNRCPLLLVDVKPPFNFQLDKGHNAAIGHIIHCLDEVGPKNQHADQLYAISAIGKW